MKLKWWNSVIIMLKYFIAGADPDAGSGDSEEEIFVYDYD